MERERGGNVRGRDKERSLTEKMEIDRVKCQGDDEIGYEN